MNFYDLLPDRGERIKTGSENLLFTQEKGSCILKACSLTRRKYHKCVLNACSLTKESVLNMGIQDWLLHREESFKNKDLRLTSCQRRKVQEWTFKTGLLTEDRGQRIRLAASLSSVDLSRKHQLCVTHATDRVTLDHPALLFRDYAIFKTIYLPRRRIDP